jgi:carbon-monoxide dehydrogenase large subunit
VEDPRFLRGSGRYIDDLHPAGLLHAVFLRSHHAHSRITRLEVGPARTGPGVVAVWTAADFAGLNPLPVETAEKGPSPAPRRPLASDRVRHAGEAIAMVIAETLEQAKDALELVEFDLEPLRVVTDVEDALKPDAPRLYEDGNQAFRSHAKHGQVKRAFDRADLVVRQRLRNQRVIPMAMEPRGAIAQVVDGRLTLTLSSQSPHSVRESIAEILGMDEKQVRVVVHDVGGGFGSKGGYYAEDVAVAEAARRLGRPVKWVEERQDNCMVTWHGRGQLQDVELAASRDGTVLAVRSQILAEMGAHLEAFTAPVPTFTPQLQTGCYRIEASESTVIGVYTNTTPTGPYRGAGRPEASYLIERMMDLLAGELEMDPAEVRRRNFVPADEFPYTNAAGLTYDSGNYAGALDLLLKTAGYVSLRRSQVEARRQGRLIGIGLSSYVEIAAGAPADRCTSRLEPDGTVTVITGSTPHGQGHETTWAQIASAQMGIPMDRVRVRYGDTDEPAYAIGTFGSRSASVSGSAVLEASKKLHRQLRQLAAGALEAAEADVVVEDGRALVRGAPSRGLSMGEVAAWALAHHQEASLLAQVSYEPPDNVFPFGAHLAQVEVDPDTGRVSLLRYVAVDDCGNVINPMIVDGQIHGAITQGVAQALFEEALYDADGQLLTGNLVTYMMPAAADVPTFELDRTVTPSPNNPMGVKGVGEGGTIGSAPAVVNAVMDALRPLGVRHLDMPLSPQRVWNAVRLATRPVKGRS